MNKYMKERAGPNINLEWLNLYSTILWHEII